MKFDRISNEDLVARFNQCGNDVNNDDETAQIVKRCRIGDLFVKWHNSLLLITNSDDNDKLKKPS